MAKQQTLKIAVELDTDRLERQVAALSTAFETVAEGFRDALTAIKISAEEALIAENSTSGDSLGSDQITVIQQPVPSTGEDQPRVVIAETGERLPHVDALTRKVAASRTPVCGDPYHRHSGPCHLYAKPVPDEDQSSTKTQHAPWCLHDEPGVTICTCRPVPDEGSETLCQTCRSTGVVSCQDEPCEHGGHTCPDCNATGRVPVPDEGSETDA